MKLVLGNHTLSYKPQPHYALDIRRAYPLDIINSVTDDDGDVSRDTTTIIIYM